MTHIVLETDASLVKTALEGDGFRLSAWGGLVTELRLLLMLDFRSFGISICNRRCNVVADALAAYGSHVLNDDQVIWDDVPLFVEGLVARDSAAVDE